MTRRQCIESNNNNILLYRYRSDQTQSIGQKQEHRMFLKYIDLARPYVLP